MTEIELNQLSIFALRELARQIGVPSPTSKKKDELIQAILDINTGKKKPYIAKTKQGRPPKNYGYPFTDVINNNVKPIYSATVLNQATEFRGCMSEFISGYLEIVSNNLAYVCSYEGFECHRVIIPFSLIVEYNLKNGDFLHVRVINTPTKIEVGEVLNINNCSIKKFNPNRKDYYEYRHEMSEDNISFADEDMSKFDIKFGESVYLYGKNNRENTESIINMLNKCEVDKKLYVNISIAEKNKCLIEKLNGAEMFVANFTDDIDTAKRVVLLAAERAKRLFESGVSVVVAIDDVLSLAGIDTQDLPVTKNLLSLAKSAPDAGSVSVFAVISSNNGISLFEKLADRRLKVLNRELFIMD